MKLTKKVMLMCVLSSLVGCAINKRSSCEGWLPIYLERKDLNVISANLAREILKHNKQGEYLCGWKHG
ncbi:hypothetical protein QVL70_06350 [Bartonella henselae]|nr:hypothetical protein [Bartonella henselae]ATP12892.1 hypothetical protein BhenCHDE101_07540 [Bartonella henselae]MDM9984059.1 hypothetical protein [Bartonella henselae]MDM9985334.1 hypothetical protein [Bartonella henselae]MDM9987055.1 hypothetical protein [Bartonella henselae]MDM9988271.1 hypothetical protein [Bartonella henselae]